MLGAGRGRSGEEGESPGPAWEWPRLGVPPKNPVGPSAPPGSRALLDVGVCVSGDILSKLNGKAGNTESAKGTSVLSQSLCVSGPAPSLSVP